MKKTLLVVSGSVFGTFLLLLVIGAIISGGSGNSPTPAASPAKHKSPVLVTPKRHSNPKPPGLNPGAGVENTVHQGKAFRLGDFHVNPGWKVTDEAYVGWTVHHLLVRNLTNGTHMFDVHIKLRRGPHRVVADIECSNDNEVSPGDVEQATCLWDGGGGTYSRITIGNTY